MQEIQSKQNPIFSTVKDAAVSTVMFHPVLTAKAIGKVPSKLKVLATDVFCKNTAKKATEQVIKEKYAFGTITKRTIGNLREQKANKVAQKAAKLTKEATEQTAKKGLKGIFAKIGNSKIGKFFSKNAMLIINAFFVAMEVFSRKDEIKETFKTEGTKAGFKKIVQIAIPGAANIAGYSAGMALGGALFGAIGSVVPVFGTALGVAFGEILGGLFASKTSQKIAQKIVGANETEETVSNEAQTTSETNTANTVNVANTANTTNTANNANVNQYWNPGLGQYVTIDPDSIYGSKELDRKIQMCLNA